MPLISIICCTHHDGVLQEPFTVKIISKQALAEDIGQVEVDTNMPILG